MKIIEIHINGKITDLKPVTIPEAHEKAKELLTCSSDYADIFLVEKEHILTIKKGKDE